MAIAAYEYNKKTILRASFKMNGKDHHANRLLIENYLEDRESPFTVKESHDERAAECVRYLQHTLMLKTLTEPRGNNFLSSVVGLLSKEEIFAKDLGILSWAPKLMDQCQEQDQVREISARFERSSGYLGKPKEKITVNFNLIERRYVPNMNCYAVYGYSDCGNLVFYWARSLDRVIEKGQLEARVKEHKTDSYHNNARVTFLNYVKVFE